jgi:hypothetical protein
MFRELGRDSFGRMRYACYRGTNALEVCIHYICLSVIAILFCYSHGDIQINLILSR